MKVPFIDLAPQFNRIRKDASTGVLRVLESQRFVLAEEGKAFEAESAKFLGVKHAIGVASGTDALILSLAALGIGPGDEVITTPFTFFATASSIVRVGARPVFCDIEKGSMNLDPAKLNEKITRRTKAILPVHLFGEPCRMDRILSVARKKKLAVIEDAAQSFGAAFQGKQTGSFGDLGCFSFYPTKNLGGAGDGGMITTNSPDLNERLRLLRDHGSRKKYIHEAVGWNSRLDELQAVVLRVKLRHIKRWNDARHAHGKAYNRAFKNLPIQLPPLNAGSIYHLYTIRTKRRDALAGHLMREGIGNGTYYPVPLHKQPCFRSMGFSSAGLEHSELASEEAISLPMFAELTPAQRTYVIKTVRAFFK